jgi:hypothetical protein
VVFYDDNEKENFGIGYLANAGAETPTYSGICIVSKELYR